MTNIPSSIDPVELEYYQSILDQTRKLDAARRHYMSHLIIKYGLGQGDAVNDETGVISRAKNEDQPKTKDPYFEMDL